MGLFLRVFSVFFSQKGAKEAYMYGFKHKKREKRHTSMSHVFPSKKYTFLPFLRSSRPHLLLYASPIFEMLQLSILSALFTQKKTIKIVFTRKTIF